MGTGLRTVWLIMLREWSATVSTPAFWRFVLIMPFVFFLSFLLLRYLASEDPRERWLIDTQVPDTQFLLEHLALNSDSIGESRSLQHYALLDQSESTSERIRAKITRRDQVLFLQTIQTMNEGEFDDFLQEIELDEASNQFVRFRKHSKINLDMSLQISTIDVDANILDSVERNLNSDTNEDSSITTEFLKFFVEWWLTNQTLIIKTSPLVSANFFLEARHDYTSDDELQSLLSQNEIVGYFVLPERQSSRTAEITFKTSTLTPRSHVLDLVNWYRSVASSVMQEERMHEVGLTRDSQENLTKKVSFRLNILEFPRPVRLRPSDIPAFVFFQFPMLLLLAFMPGAFRIASMIQEEKSNKLTDVLLSNVYASQLLDGKFLGTTLTSLTVVLIWIVLIWSLVTLFTGSSIVQNLSYIVPFLRVPIILNFVLFLVLMYAFYGYLFSAFVSMTNTAQQAMQSVIVAAYVILIFAVPSLLVVLPGLVGELFQNVVSFFPPSTPFMMVARSVNLPDWPIYIAIVVLMLVSVFVARAFASRAFVLGVIDELRIARFNPSKNSRKSVLSA